MVRLASILIGVLLVCALWYQIGYKAAEIDLKNFYCQVCKETTP